MKKLRDLVPWKNEVGGAPAGDLTPFTNLRREINGLFDDFFSSDIFHAPFAALEERFRGFSPRVNVDEDDKEITVRCELPGMDEKDVDISLTDNSLTIRGERRKQSESREGASVWYAESSYGAFQRTIPLGVEIDEDKVEAGLKQGILTIRLPKTESAQKKARKVSIKSE